MTSDELSICRKLIDIGIFVIYGHRSRAFSIACQRNADALLLITGSGAVKSIATGKVFEYICAGKPILALTKNSEAEKVIKSANVGIFADTERISQIRKAYRRC